VSGYTLRCLPTAVAVILLSLAAWVPAPVLADYPDDCQGVAFPSAPDCSALDGLDYTGCCDSAGRLVWCDADGLYCLDCAGLNPECGWSPDAGFYDCGTDGSEDPSGAFPKECETCDPKCGPGFKCVQGTCEVCVPQCEGKQCGKDGCGGTCGNCEGDLVCTPGGQCVEVPQCKVAGAFHCDETHKGTTAGALNVLQDYSCYFDLLDGAEVGYSFTAPADDTLHIEFKPPSDMLDSVLIVLADSCTEQTCEDWFWDGEAAIPVVAGQTYFFVIDGYAGAEGDFELTLKCESTCVPDCDGKQCGTDGCFGTCGECVEGVCSNGFCMTSPGCLWSEEPGCGGCPCESCVCAMDDFCCSVMWDDLCVGECVNDCGGCAPLENCGDSICQVEEFETCANCPGDCPCPPGESCFNGKCCHPDCSGKECGDDGCGGSCGGCPENLACIDNTCQENDGCAATVTPGCPGCICEACVCDMYPPCCEEAWDDLCASFCEGWCEGCGKLVACGDGACQPDLLETCSTCPGDCTCPEGQPCLYGECCVPSCEWVECGDDGCGGNCADCPEGQFCSWEGLCMEGGGGCEESPVPGCGGCACETCVCNLDPFCCESSWDSLCVEECLYDCGGCGDAPETCGNGICAADDGENCGTCDKDCGCLGGEVCMFDTCCKPACAGKECGDDGCGGTCGECDVGCSCSAEGQCLGECGCIPNCALKECGDNGCGGTCGECEKGAQCNADGTCEPICAPDCEGRECGNDGCGGTCGDCPAGETCLPNGTCSLPTPDPAGDVVTGEPAADVQAADSAPVDSSEVGTDETASGETDDTATASGGCSGCTTATPRFPMPTLLLAGLLLIAGRMLAQRTARRRGRS